MKREPDWQPAQQGVMIYMPAPRVIVEVTQQSLSQLSFSDHLGSGAQNQLSEVSDVVLPSCELSPDTHVKIEQEENKTYSIPHENSPDTLVADSYDEKALTPTSTESPYESLGNSQALYVQLLEHAAHAHTEPQETVTMQHVITASSDVAYDSDRTDFQLTDESPCIRKIEPQSKRTASQRYKIKRARLRSQLSPTRQLDFGTSIAKKLAKPTEKTANELSLEKLKEIERGPSHTWTQDERELLCVLNRWYCAADRSTELQVFAETFNYITGLNLRARVIRTQFESHLLVYGGEAYPLFRRVFAVPFDDPEGRYANLRAVIETEACTLELDLRRRQFDQQILSGTARYTKSPQIRKTYKCLIRKASQEQCWEGIKVTTDSRAFARSSMAVQVSMEDNYEILTDIDDTPDPVTDGAGHPRPALPRPYLAFRVWDANNRTKFIDGSFVAQAFIDWPRPLPSPIALDDPSGAGKILASLHLCKDGDTPVYISTASSLIQALSYAKDMKQPSIALIDLNSPMLQQEQKLHHAAEVFPWLKSQGLARWARYKGHGEYFAFAEIPSDAVICAMDLTYLIEGLKQDSDCQRLLDFDSFRPGIKTKVISAALRDRNTRLDTATARAMGKAAKVFGICQVNATLEHMTDFVARIIDGWSVQEIDHVGMHTMDFLAATFATSLGKHAGGHTIHDMKTAFIKGVNHGSFCIAHWSRSRSGTRRQRFREG